MAISFWWGIVYFDICELNPGFQATNGVDKESVKLLMKFISLNYGLCNYMNLELC